MSSTHWPLQYHENFLTPILIYRLCSIQKLRVLPPKLRERGVRAQITGHILKRKQVLARYPSADSMVVACFASLSPETRQKRQAQEANNQPTHTHTHEHTHTHIHTKQMNGPGVPRKAAPPAKASPAAPGAEARLQREPIHGVFCICVRIVCIYICTCLRVDGWIDGWIDR